MAMRTFLIALAAIASVLALTHAQSCGVNARALTEDECNTICAVDYDESTCSSFTFGCENSLIETTCCERTNFSDKNCPSTAVRSCFCSIGSLKGGGIALVAVSIGVFILMIVCVVLLICCCCCGLKGLSRSGRKKSNENNAASVESPIQPTPSDGPPPGYPAVAAGSAIPPPPPPTAPHAPTGQSPPPPPPVAPYPGATSAAGVSYNAPPPPPPPAY